MNVQLMADWTKADWQHVFPSTDAASKIPGLQAGYCLDGTATLPTRQFARGDPSVAIRVVALEPDSRTGQSVLLAPAAAQEMMDRPHIHAALSTCLQMGARRQRFQLHYTHEGDLHQVSGDGAADDRRCVWDALEDLKFGKSLYYAPTTPGFTEPGWTMILELERKK